MLRRKAYDRLMEWKSRNNHKGLLVRGPRQVGKTYIIGVGDQRVGISDG